MHQQQQTQGGQVASSAVRRLLWDWKEVREEPLRMLSAAPLTPDQPFLWHANLKCLSGPFSGTIVHLTLHFSESYPEVPPSVSLCPQTFRYSPGRVHLWTGHSKPFGGDEANLCPPFGEWSSTNSVMSILLQLYSLLFILDEDYSSFTFTQRVALTKKSSEGFACEACGHTHSSPSPPLPLSDFTIGMKDDDNKRKQYHALLEACCISPTNKLTVPPLQSGNYDDCRMFYLANDGLTCEALSLSRWLGTTGIQGCPLSGKETSSYYFEITILKSSGVARVGFSTNFTSSQQLGTDTHSWGYGATGKKCTRNIFQHYGEGFGKGDTIGCYFDATRRTISFSKNGRSFGVAFQLPSSLFVGGYASPSVLYPAVCLKCTRAKLNFGAEPFASFSSSFLGEGAKRASKQKILKEEEEEEEEQEETEEEEQEEEQEDENEEECKKRKRMGTRKEEETEVRKKKKRTKEAHKTFELLPAEVMEMIVDQLRLRDLLALSSTSPFLSRTIASCSFIQRKQLCCARSKLNFLEEETLVLGFSLNVYLICQVTMQKEMNSRRDSPLLSLEECYSDLLSWQSFNENNVPRHHFLPFALNHRHFERAVSSGVLQTCLQQQYEVMAWKVLPSLTASMVLYVLGALMSAFATWIVREECRSVEKTLLLYCHLHHLLLSIAKWMPDVENEANRVIEDFINSKSNTSDTFLRQELIALMLCNRRWKELEERFAVAFFEHSVKFTARQCKSFLEVGSHGRGARVDEFRLKASFESSNVVLRELLFHIQLVRLFQSNFEMRNAVLETYDVRYGRPPEPAIAVLINQVHRIRQVTNYQECFELINFPMSKQRLTSLLVDAIFIHNSNSVKK